MAGSFLDTNILLYLASADAAKADRAEALLDAGGTISVQVLNEIANVGRRKLGWSWARTRRFLETIRALLTVEKLTETIHEAGIDIAERHQLALYDAMIVAAAQHAGCDVLYSEDMQHGMQLRQLRIVNPFHA